MRDRWNEFAAYGLFLSALAAQPLFVLIFWSRTWDDSAITMSFAQTFAHTGVIEGTHGSGIVEGYSTTLWMLVVAALSRFASSPAALLTSAKILGCALNMLNIALAYRFARRWGGSIVAGVTAGAFGLTELTLYESVNAMEGPLMAALMLMAVLCLPLKRRRDTAIFLTCTCLFLLTRFEAFLLVFPLLLVVRPWSRRILASAAWLATLGATEVARWSYFGSLVPNTILAKRRFPYFPLTLREEIERHFSTAVTVSRLLAMLLIVLLIALFLDRRRLVHLVRRMSATVLWSRLKERYENAAGFDIAFVLALTGLLVDFMVGANWGPPDRELFSTLPFLIYCLVYASLWAAHRPSHRRAICALFVVALSYRAVRTAQRLHDPAAPLYMPLITIETIAKLLPPVEGIRRASGLATLTFATPDVGGVMLFGGDLRILDLGMLCDRRLALTGYSQAPQYLLDERMPEVMEMHSFWNALVGLGDSQKFYEEYAVVYVGKTRYFVRRDILARFAEQTVRRSFSSDGHPQPEEDEAAGPKELIYPEYDQGDLGVNKKFGTYARFSPSGLLHYFGPSRQDAAKP